MILVPLPRARNERLLTFLGTEHVTFAEDGIFNFLSAEMATFNVSLISHSHFASPFTFNFLLLFLSAPGAEVISCKVHFFIYGARFANAAHFVLCFLTFPSYGKAVNNVVVFFT